MIPLRHNNFSTIIEGNILCKRGEGKPKQRYLEDVRGAKSNDLKEEVDVTTRLFIHSLMVIIFIGECREVKAKLKIHGW